MKHEPTFLSGRLALQYRIMSPTGLAVIFGTVVLMTAFLAPKGVAGEFKQTKTAEVKPNVIIILADDLGYNDLSLNGGWYANTPHIDSIAQNGVNFRTSYATNSVCAPSRAALLTGRYQQRFGFEYNPLIPNAKSPVTNSEVTALYKDGEWLPEMKNIGIPDTEITLAQTLQKAGYRTSVFGKWHLGYDQSKGPARKGFDYSLIFPAGGALYAPVDTPGIIDFKLVWSKFDHMVWRIVDTGVLRNGQPEKAPYYMTDFLADEASAFIKRNQEKPFFLYLAFNAPHNPLQARKDKYDTLSNISDKEQRVYTAMVETLDDAVGRVLNTLDKTGLSDNTIVIFASDNGGAAYLRIPYLNLPFRGWKATFFEGGVRVPLMIRWPAKLAKNRTITSPVSLLDIFPTIAAAAGADTSNSKILDGIDLFRYLVPEEKIPDNRALFWRTDRYKAVRVGHYKLQLDEHSEKIWLFDLEQDPVERHNIASKLPSKVVELQTILDEHEKGLVPPAWPAMVRKRTYIDGTVDPMPDDAEFVEWTL